MFRGKNLTEPVNVFVGSAASKLKRRYTSYKVKVESRSDAFLEDHSHQWDVGSAVRIMHCILYDEFNCA